MDPLQVHKNGKIFLLLDTEIGAVGHIASMAILPAGALPFLFLLVVEFGNVDPKVTVRKLPSCHFVYHSQVDT